MNYIGIDLGTSSVKLVLMDTAGHIIANVSKSYPIDYPKAGWSEQNPYDWYDACIPYTTIHSISVFILTDLYSESSVKAIRIL